jgi:hypothetical protein
MVGRATVSLLLGREGLLCALTDPRIFANASEVPLSNKAAATTIRADLVMLFLRAQAILTSTYGFFSSYQA